MALNPMSNELMDAAYKIARANYNAADLATFKALEAKFENAGFEAIHHSVERALRLNISAMDLASKVWAHTLSYEKAEEILGNQFAEFPVATRQKALGDAYTDAR